MRRLWRDFAFAGVLLLLPLVLFAPVVLGDKTILPADVLYTFEPYRTAAGETGATDVQNGLLADLILENYPWKRFLTAALRTKQLPLWDPYLFAGHPFLANGQHSALYPLTWIFFLLPIPRAFGAFIALQLGLAGISMYILGRTIGAGRFGAFLAGITFQFSGFLVVSAVHPMIVAAASWLPLLLALADLTVRRARFLRQERAMLPWALLGAAVLGLQILAGHAEATYFVLLVTGAFGAWRLAHTALTHPRDRWRADVLSPALGLLLMAGLGLALGAVQLVPLYEVVSTSFRQGAVSLTDVLGWAYPKRRIITFFVPNFFGNPAHHTLHDIFTGQTLRATVNAYGDPISSFDWGMKNYVEGGAYLGILPLLLALVAVISRKSGVEGQKSKVESRESKVESRESKVGSRKSEVGSRESGVGGRRSGVEGRESKVEGQESGVGSRESGVGSRGSEVGSRKPGVESRKSDLASPKSKNLSPFQGTQNRLIRWLRHPYIPFFTALSLFSLGCIFGTPLYALVYALPLLNQSHSPFRWVFPLTVAVAALAALGATTVADYRKSHGPERPGGKKQEAGGRDGEWRMENGEFPPAPLRDSASIPLAPLRGLRQHPKSKNLSPFQGIQNLLLFSTSPNTISIIAVIAIWTGFLALAGLWLSRIAFGRIEPLIERLFWSLALAPNAFPDHRAFYAYLFPWLQAAAIFLTGAGIVLRVSRCPIYLPRRLGGRPIWEPLAISVLLADVLIFGAGFNPAVDPALLDYTPPVVEFLRQDTSLWRFSTFDPHGRRTFNANTGMFYDFQDVRGYDSLFPAQVARYMGWIEPQNELLYNRIAPFTQFSSLDSPLTDLLNVKYIVTEEEIPLPKYDLVYRDDGVRVYENLGATPRAFTLPATATLIVPDIEAVGDAVMHYDPRRYAIVEAEATAHLPDLPGAPTPATLRAQPVRTYSANEVRIDATIDEPAWLILTDTYFPGWKAFVHPPGTPEDQEREVPIARVAGNFRGVLLEESATVRFKYSPNSVKFGAFGSFLAGMILVFLAVVWTWRLIYREKDDRSTVQRLAKNSIVPILLTLFNRVVDLAFAALMLRILGPANAGDYYYAINIFIWFDIITNFGLDAYLTREVARHRDQANRYLFNTTAIRLGLSVAGISLLAGFIALRQTLIADFTAPASTQALIALALLYVGLIPGSISKGLTSLFYAYEKAEVPAAVSTISTLLKVAVQTAILLAGWGIIGLAGTAIAINLATLAILGTLATRLFFRPRWQPERALRREMAAESWPLMLNHFLATLFYKVDVFLMEPILGSTTLGLYSLGYKFLDALMVVPSMFTLALFPMISRQAQEDRAGFLRFYQLAAKILLALALPAAVVATLTAREMVLILGGPQYLPGGMDALRLMAWAMPIGWINSLTQYVLIALDQQRYLTRAYLFGFAVNLVANLIFMPIYGYRASAIIHILSETALFIPFAIGVQRQLRAIRWWSIIGKPILATLAMVAVAALLLPVGRWPALAGALVVYPLVVWQLNMLTTEEQTLLAPLLHRRAG